RVATVEGAQKIAPILAIQYEESGRLLQEPADESPSFSGVEMPRRQPRVRVDDVRRDQGVLEIEERQLAVGGQNGGATARFACRPGLALGAGAHAGVLDDRRQVDVVQIGLPID